MCYQKKYDKIVIKYMIDLYPQYINEVEILTLVGIGYSIKKGKIRVGMNYSNKNINKNLV
jgi:hypothetical protein